MLKLKYVSKLLNEGERNRHVGKPKTKLHIILNVTNTCVPALPNSVGNSLPIMDLPTLIHSYFCGNLNW